MEGLIADIEAFMGAHSMSQTMFGVRALNDRHFVKSLRKGRRLWPETEAKVRRFMATYRPADAPELAKAS